MTCLKHSEGAAGGAVDASTKNATRLSVSKPEPRRKPRIVMNTGPRSYEDRPPLAPVEDCNPASDAELPFTVDDTGDGLWVVLTAFLVFAAPQLIDWMIWDAVQGVQPW